MRYIPPEVLLSWPNPNYTDPETRGNALVVVNSIFLSLVILVVALRLYTRIIVKRWFGSDDAFIMLALISTIGLTTVVLLANESYGWDRHIYDIPLAKIAPTGKIAMAAKIMFTSAATFTRLSLLFFYYRLVHETTKRTFVLAIHANVAFTVAIFITLFFMAIFQCHPIRNYWIFGAPPETCTDEGSSTLAVGIITCIADLMCTLLPIPMVAKLQMPKRQRVAVVVLFSLGFIVTIAGVVRTYFIYRSFFASYDQTWEAYPLWICGAIEVDLGVICASAPVLRPLLSKIPFARPSFSRDSTKVLKSTGYSKGSSNGDSDATDPSGITLQDIGNSKRQSDSDTRERSDDLERGVTGDEGSVRESGDAILSRQEEQYKVDPREHWRRSAAV